jgi:hypothetical protein
MRLPYGPATPPVDPPPGADRLVWRLARGLYDDHNPGDGWLVLRLPRLVAVRSTPARRVPPARSGPAQRGA